MRLSCEHDRQVQHWLGGALLGEYPRPDAWPSATDTCLAALLRASEAASAHGWPPPPQAVVDELDDAFLTLDDARSYALRTVDLYRETKAHLEAIAPKLMAVAALQCAVPLLIAAAERAERAREELRRGLETFERIESTLSHLTP